MTTTTETENSSLVKCGMMTTNEIEKSSLVKCGMMTTTTETENSSLVKCGMTHCEREWFPAMPVMVVGIQTVTENLTSTRPNYIGELPDIYDIFLGCILF